MNTYDYFIFNPYNNYYIWLIVTNEDNLSSQEIRPEHNILII